MVPAGIAALTLVTYGVLSVAVFLGQLRSGEVRWPDVREGWATTATLLVFLGWGVALAVTTIGYALATRPGTEKTPPPAPQGPGPFTIGARP